MANDFLERMNYFQKNEQLHPSGSSCMRSWHLILPDDYDAFAKIAGIMCAPRTIYIDYSDLLSFFSVEIEEKRCEGSLMYYEIECKKSLLGDFERYMECLHQCDGGFLVMKGNPVLETMQLGLDMIERYAPHGKESILLGGSQMEEESDMIMARLLVREFNG